MINESKHQESCMFLNLKTHIFTFSEFLFLNHHQQSYICSNVICLFLSTPIVVTVSHFLLRTKRKVHTVTVCTWNYTHPPKAVQNKNNKRRQRRAFQECLFEGKHEYLCEFKVWKKRVALLKSKHQTDEEVRACKVCSLFQHLLQSSLNTNFYFLKAHFFSFHIWSSDIFFVNNL